MPSRYDALLRIIAFATVLNTALMACYANSQTAQRSTRQESSANNNKETSWYDPIVILTVFIALFNGGLLVVTIYLSRSTRIAADAAHKAADVADQALTVLERPYLFIEAPKIIQSVSQGPGLQIKPQRVFSYEFTNYGKTPAIVRWMDATIKIGDSNNFWQEIFNGRTIFAAGEQKAIDPLHSFPIPEIPAIGVVHQTSILTIAITYWDVFDWIHVDEFKFFRMGDRFVPIAGNENNRRNTKKLREGEEWNVMWSRNLLSEPPP